MARLRRINMILKEMTRDFPRCSSFVLITFRRMVRSNQSCQRQLSLSGKEERRWKINDAGAAIGLRRSCCCRCRRQTGLPGVEARRGLGKLLLCIGQLLVDNVVCDECLLIARYRLFVGVFG